MDRLLDAGIDIQKLSRDGVTIFFMQVFDHAFFHADMHPGNILVGTEGDQISTSTSGSTSASSAR